jgi:hypothetical protein
MKFGGYYADIEHADSCLLIAAHVKHEISVYRNLWKRRGMGRIEVAEDMRHMGVLEDVGDRLNPKTIGQELNGSSRERGERGSVAYPNTGNSLRQRKDDRQVFGCFIEKISFVGDVGFRCVGFDRLNQRGLSSN